MMQRWKARWIEDGKQREFLFDSLNNLMIARIDFKVKFPYAFFDKKIPEHYELEEVNYAGAYCTPLIQPGR